MRTSCVFRLAVLIWVLPVNLIFCQMDQLRPEPPGKLVDIGGRKLHVYCTGKGGPIVILEAGAGSFSTDWAPLVQPRSRRQRGCARMIALVTGGAIVVLNGIRRRRSQGIFK